MRPALKSALSRNPQALAVDFAGAAALAVALVGGLYLPGLI